MAIEQPVLLSATDIKLHFKESPFKLDISNFKISESEIFGLMGPNGAGKSTFLKVLAFLQEPDTGQICFRDYSNPNASLMRKRITLVFSKPILYKTSVRENIAIGLKLRDEKSRNIENKVNEYLDYFKIKHLADRSANLLSSGEKQRVILSRALVLEPELLLLDEPLSSLDEPTKESLLQDLQSVMSNKHITTILVSQSRKEILSLCHRVGVMIDGKILQTGSTEDVFNKPNCQQVADFVGMETVLSGEIVSESEGMVYVNPVRSVFTGSVLQENVSDNTSNGVKVQGNNLICAQGVFPVGTKVIIGIRPEEVILMKNKSEKGQLSTRNIFRSKIKRIIPLGYQYKILLDCRDDPLRGEHQCSSPVRDNATVTFPITSIIAKISLEELGLKEGEECFVLFKANAVHIIKQ